jgi:hypothetical protein
LPILCEWIPCLAFGFLFFWTTPCKLNIIEFEVRVKHCHMEVMTWAKKHEKRHTESKDKRGLFIKPRVILIELCKPVIDCCMISQEMCIVMFCFPGGLKFFNCRESSPEGWTFLNREVLLDSVKVLVTSKISYISNIDGIHTLLKSQKLPLLFPNLSLRVRRQTMVYSG